MSVTIVSALPKPAQTTTADNLSSKSVENDSSSASQDFASLLQSQLPPITPGTLAETTTQADRPEADATPIDAASLFASLGLVSQEPNGLRNSDAQGTDSDLLDTGKDDKTTPDPLITIPAVPVITNPKLDAGLSVKQDGKAELVATDHNLDAGLSVKQDVKAELVATDPKLPITTNVKLDSKTESITTEPKLAESFAAKDKPAKFAVPLLIEQNKETAIPKAPSSEASPNNLSALINNVTAHSNSTLPSREASLSVPTPIRDQNWASDFGQKIVWLANNDKHAAQLTLNPPQMGPIEISLNVDKDKATATFVSANADVRATIETAMPKLREMFASAGIELGQTNVSAESFKQHTGNENGNRSASPWRNDNAILVADSAGSLPAKSFFTQQGNGMVDIFA